MPLFQLNRLQKNQLHEIIRTNGLSPAKFSWGEFRREFITLEALLCEGDSGRFYFAFDFSGGEFGAVMKPLIDGCEYLQTRVWEGILSAFARWLSIVKAEWEEPDLWSTPFPEALSGEIAGDENRKFTVSEVKQIKKALADIKRKVSTLPNFGPKRLEKLDQVLSYIADKAETETVFDWKNVTLGAIMGVYSSVLFTPFANAFRGAVSEHLMPLMNGLLGLH